MTDPFCEGLRATIRDAIASHFDTYTDEEVREFVAESLNLPKRPTLADMTEEERRACQWMQADTETWGRVVIITPHLRWGSSALLDRWGDVAYEAHANITPRPDLPRLEWPGDTPTPTPATLTEGSEWGDIDALTTACRTSGRDQIVVADCQGDVSVWSAVSGWWEAGMPSDGYEPFTILHAGKGGDQ